MKLVAAGIVVPAAASLFLLAFASFLPIRFDRRTLQGLGRLEFAGVPPGRNVLFLSADNEYASFEVAAFALPHATFPRGERAWIVLKETTHGPWSGGFLGLDAERRFSAPVTQPSGWSWTSVPEPPWVKEAIRGWVLVYDSDEVRQEFQRRLPSLAEATQTVVLSPAPRALVPVQRPSSMFTATRWLRIAALLGVMTTAVLAWPSRGEPSATRTMARGALIWAAVWAVISTTYLAGELWPRVSVAVPILLWVVGLVVLYGAEGAFPQWPNLRSVWPLAAMAMVYTGVMCARLDFDGDTYSTYLAVAKYHHWLGRHDPGDPALRALVQALVYPPGFPMLISLCLWALDLPRAEPLRLDAATSAAILLYRLVVSALNLACLVCLGSYVRARGVAVPLAWMTPVIGALLLVPSLRGQHMSAETVLVPLLATALVAVMAGRRHGDPRLCGLGLFLAATMTFVKLEGVPYLLLIILPAAASIRTSWSARTRLAVWAAGAAGLVPTLAWRLSGPGQNPSFGALDPRHALDALQGLSSLAVKLLLKSELWISLVLLLPVAAAWRLCSERRIQAAFLPAGIVALSFGGVLLYSVSTLGAHSHMEVSFVRIMLAPGLAAFIYAVDAFAPPEEKTC